MPTQLEKTAAFLKKMAAEGSIIDKGLWGPDAPFQQPAPSVSQQELMDAASVGSRGPNAPNAGNSQNIIDQLTKAQTAAAGKGVAQSELDRINDNYGPETGKPAVAAKEPPGFMSNVRAGLERGHVGTVAGVGAATLLAGVLTYNMLKKKKGGKITQMPGQRKAASVWGSVKGLGTKAKDAAKGAYGKAKGVVESHPKSTAAAAGAVGGGAAVGAANLATGGEKNLAEQVGLPASVTTGSKGGDLAVAGGAVALGTAGLIALYKKLRGSAA